MMLLVTWHLSEKTTEIYKVFKKILADESAVIYKEMGVIDNISIQKDTAVIRTLRLDNILIVLSLDRRLSSYRMVTTKSK